MILLFTIRVFCQLSQPININISVPPKIQIEVDIDAHLGAFGTPDGYIYTKTDKLLQFGVEKVIWLTSESRKVLVATKDENWSIID